MQVKISEQTFFNFLIMGKFRFPPKTSFITSTTGHSNIGNYKGNKTFQICNEGSRYLDNEIC